jgi:flagellar biosynthesis/type III secretory pathway protein FliH
MNGLRKRISTAALMFAMAIGIGLSASTSAQAQWRNDNYVRWDRERTRQYALLLGYHNAYSEGKEVAERRGRVDYRNMPGYRQGTNGWLAWMGHQDTYRDSYRRGYEAGFKDGQERRGRRYGKDDVERVLGDSLKNVYGNDSYDYDDDYYDRNGRRDGDWNDRRDGGWNDRNDRNNVYRIAQQNGYNRGLRSGQEDRARRRSYDYDDTSEYRNATEGYRSQYGDREAYRQGFRDGFRQGYEDGYRGRGTSRNTSRDGWRWPF